MKVLFAAIALWILSACSSTPLEDHPGFDNYPLRSASPDEEKRLKHCHRAIFEAQKHLKLKTGRYSAKVSSLGVESDCSNLAVMVETHARGYLAIAKINQDKTTVRWLSDETGKIFEELDEAPDPNNMSPNDSDSEYGFGF